MHTLLRSPVRPLLFGLVGLAALFAIVAAPRLGGPPARAQSAGDQSLLLQLAQRLLAGYIPGQPAGSFPASVQLFPGAIAPEFPSDVPLPSESTVIGSDEHPSAQLSGPVYGNTGMIIVSPSPPPSSGTHVDVVLDVPGSSADLMSFYKQALTAAGWTASTGGIGGFGFLSSTLQLQPTMYCRAADKASLAVSARTSDSGPLDVRLSFDTGFSPQCSPPSTLPSPPSNILTPLIPGLGVIPGLAPPDGVRVVSTGGSGGGPNRFGTDAVAVTDMSVADLHSFYAGELNGAGWTQLGSGDDSSLTWSTWAIPNHADLQGFLYVRNGPADGQRSLHLEVASTDPNAVSANGGYYGVGGAFSVVNPVVQPPPAAATPTPAP